MISLIVNAFADDISDGANYDSGWLMNPPVLAMAAMTMEVVMMIAMTMMMIM